MDWGIKESISCESNVSYDRWGGISWVGKMIMEQMRVGFRIVPNDEMESLKARCGCASQPVFVHAVADFRLPELTDAQLELVRDRIRQHLQNERVTHAMQLRIHVHSEEQLKTIMALLVC